MTFYISISECDWSNCIDLEVSFIHKQALINESNSRIGCQNGRHTGWQCYSQAQYQAGWQKGSLSCGLLARISVKDHSISCDQTFFLHFLSLLHQLLMINDRYQTVNYISVQIFKRVKVYMARLKLVQWILPFWLHTCMRLLNLHKI